MDEEPSDRCHSVVIGTGIVGDGAGFGRRCSGTGPATVGEGYDCISIVDADGVDCIADEAGCFRFGGRT